MDPVTHAILDHLLIHDPLYGKVDRVPGFFYVATDFAGIMHLPMLPKQSYLVVEYGSDKPIRIALGLSKKSVLLGWFELLILLAEIPMLIATLVLTIGLLLGDFWTVNYLIMTGFGSALLFGILLRAGRGLHAKPKRAFELAALAGLEVEAIADYFRKDSDVIC
jgi:hypothetical protein